MRRLLLALPVTVLWFALVAPPALAVIVELVMVGLAPFPSILMPSEDEFDTVTWSRLGDALSMWTAAGAAPA